MTHPFVQLSPDPWRIRQFEVRLPAIHILLKLVCHLSHSLAANAARQLPHAQLVGLLCFVCHAQLYNFALGCPDCAAAKTVQGKDIRLDRQNYRLAMKRLRLYAQILGVPFQSDSGDKRLKYLR